MTYVSKCDAVADQIEERKILEIEQYGLIMTTHRLVHNGEYQWGRPAEAVAVAFKGIRSFETWTTKLRNVGKRRLGIIYSEEQFLPYHLVDQLIKKIEAESFPFLEVNRDDDGNRINGALGAYYLTELISSGEVTALVHQLNDGFSKARTIFREKIKAQATIERENQQRTKRDFVAELKSLKEL